MNYSGCSNAACMTWIFCLAVFYTRGREGGSGGGGGWKLQRWAQDWTSTASSSSLVLFEPTSTRNQWLCWHRHDWEFNLIEDGWEFNLIEASLSSDHLQSLESIVVILTQQHITNFPNRRSSYSCSGFWFIALCFCPNLEWAERSMCVQSICWSRT